MRVGDLWFILWTVLLGLCAQHRNCCVTLILITLWKRPWGRGLISSFLFFVCFAHHLFCCHQVEVKFRLDLSRTWTFCKIENLKTFCQGLNSQPWYWEPRPPASSRPLPPASLPQLCWLRDKVPRLSGTWLNLITMLTPTICLYTLSPATVRHQLYCHGERPTHPRRLTTWCILTNWEHFWLDGLWPRNAILEKIWGVNLCRTFKRLKIFV